MGIKASDLLEKTVVTGDGFIVGEVNELVVHPDRWQVTDIQVKVDKKNAKEVGLKTPFFGSLLVLVDTERVDSAADQIILDFPRGELKEYVESRQAAEKESGKKDKKKKDEADEAEAEE
jgi:sporulation protein YlmC with PRC-barrel domain